MPPPVVTLGIRHWHAPRKKKILARADGALLAAASGATVRFVDPATGGAVGSLRCTSAVRCVALSGDGVLLASGCADGTVLRYSVKTCSSLATLSAHSDAVGCLAFSPDGGWRLASCGSSLIRLWESATGLLLLTLDCGARISSVAFAPDGVLLAAAINSRPPHRSTGGPKGASNDGIKLFDSLSGACVALLLDRPAPASSTSTVDYCVAWSANGAWIVLGCSDGALRLFARSHELQLVSELQMAITRVRLLRRSGRALQLDVQVQDHAAFWIEKVVLSEALTVQIAEDIKLAIVGDL